MSNLSFTIGIVAHLALAAMLLHVWFERRTPAWRMNAAPSWIAVFVTTHFWVEVLR